MNKIYNDLSEKIIGCAIEVHRHLGPGLLESAYQECLAYELDINNIKFKKELQVLIKYKSITLDCGYRLDFLIEDKIILELKSVEDTQPIHEAQILTYMKLLEIRKGFLINFNKTLLKNGIKSFLL